MDALSNLLLAVKLTGAIVLHARFTEPWCIESKSGCDGAGIFAGVERIVFFHIVTHGRFRAKLPGQSEIVELQAGDLILLAQDDTHILGSDLQLEPVPVHTIMRPAPPDGMITIDHGGGGTEAQMMCGFLACDSQLSQPLLNALPRLLHMPLGDEPTAAWLLHLLRQGAKEVTSLRPGTRTVITKLSELMFVEAMRRYIESLPDSQSGWLAGLRDRYVGRTLSLMHDRPAHDWDMNKLALEAGLSRSALAQRFTELIGQPPMQYLTQWRLSLAAEQLRHSTRTISAIALEAGYESEAAFSRAFKRQFNMPPGAWRKQRRVPDHKNVC